MDSVIVEEKYSASPENVWKALTDKEAMKKWYFDLPEFRAEVGFEFSFTGIGVKGEQYHHNCMITEVIPSKKLQYSWQYDAIDGNSLVTFELFPEAAGTRVKLTHSGLDSFPGDTSDLAAGNFHKGWNDLLHTNLKQYLTTD